jgi:hypothetical protein
MFFRLPKPGATAARLRACRKRLSPTPIGSMSVLLVLLSLNVFVLPFAADQNSLLARIGRDLLLSLILLSGVSAVSERRTQLIVMAMVGVLTTLVRWGGWLFPVRDMLGLLDGTALVSLGVLGAVIGFKVFSGSVATLERILGAVALYVLIGVIWAEAYQLVSGHIAGAYAGAGTAKVSADNSTWVYFSFVTLTTVGYGDVTPVAPAARSLAIIEAMIGQLYPAIILARLVSLHAAKDGAALSKG